MPNIDINVVALFKAKPGMEQRVRQALERAIEPTLGEDPNVGYALHQGADDPSMFVLYEGWKTADGFKQHTQLPHFKQLAGDLEGTLERPFEVITLRYINGTVPVPGPA